MKVFGIGLSRTGTQSLNTALNILGIKSLHFPIQPKIMSQLREGNYNLDIFNRKNEPVQALTDIITIPFFKGLDKAHPESKFILTIRNKDEWLGAIQRHWRRRAARYKQGKGCRPNEEWLIRKVFGDFLPTSQDNADTYIVHHRNVAGYFRERQDDLLVLNICAGEGWERLCPFLGVDIPNEPFPWKNKSTAR